MIHRYFNTRLLMAVGVVLTILVASIGFAIAQGPGQPPGQPRPFDPLVGLRHALEDAGAPALSTEQESALVAIGKSFRESLPKPGQPGQDDPMRAAHRAYEQAILAGDTASAQAQATALANTRAAMQGAHMRAEAAAQIQVLNVLKTNAAQYGALLQRFGAAGIPGLLRSPLGPMGPGPGPGGPGGPGGPAGFGGHGAPPQNLPAPRRPGQ